MGDDNHPLARACLYPMGLAPGIVKADCFRLRMNLNIAANGYVELFLNCPARRGRLDQLGQGVTRDRINLTTLLGLLVACPPMTEQQQIVAANESLGQQIESAKAEGSKLSELKSGLMSDLLTGRVRVPEEYSV
jgi:type I restriction enzyme S subunit